MSAGKNQYPDILTAVLYIVGNGQRKFPARDVSAFTAVGMEAALGRRKGQAVWTKKWAGVCMLTSLNSSDNTIQELSACTISIVSQRM